MQSDVYHFVRFFVDGGVLGQNPSRRGIYWSMRLDVKPPVILRRRSSEYKTNDDAEWHAIREALYYARAHYADKPIVIYSDSKSVIARFNGQHRIKVPRHAQFYRECRAAADALKWVAVEWVPRHVLVDKLGH